MNETMRRLITAANEHDLDGLVALFHPDYRSRQPAHPARTFVGAEQVRLNWDGMFAGIPDFRNELIGWAQDGETTWVEWAWHGTRTDGLAFDMRGTALFVVEGGLIVDGTLYMEPIEQEAIGIDQVVRDLAGGGPDTSTS